MQALIFRKISVENLDQALWSWYGKNEKELNNEFNQKGKIIVIQYSSREDLNSYFKSIKYLDCGVKKEQIELYRELKLHWKKNRDLLRRLVTDYPDLAAAKRSIFRFFKRYMPDDPPCMLFIPDEVFSEAISTLDIKTVINPSQDPISSLITETENKPVVQEIKEVFLGESPDARFTRAMIYKASLSDSPVLILGESGTGKDIIARQIYKYSTQNKNNFISVNCSAIQETLIESELFGHLKGAFSGANEDKEGLFSAADKGTLFLDEIGDLSPSNQTKILKAIEDKEIRPVGSTETKTVNVRIIAATNRDLEYMMDQETFRDDLYFRLNSFTIISAPLRRHPEDISVIAQEVWSQLGNTQVLSEEFINHLKKYPWPGNIRELNTILKKTHDMFPTNSPQIEHIEAIRKMRYDTLKKTSMTGENDIDKAIISECKNRLIEVQNIMRRIKIAVRPLTHESINKNEKKNLRNFKYVVEIEIDKLEEICREPIYIGNEKLFNNITRFRYLLEKKIKNMPNTAESINIYWRKKALPLYDIINGEIFNIVYGEGKPQIPESNNTN